MFKNLLVLATLLTSSLMLFVACTTAPLQMEESKLAHTYASLKMLDLEQMSEIVQRKLKSFEVTDNKEFLLEAIKICLSRPNADGMIEKIIGNIRFGLDSKEIWESAVTSVVQQAIDVLKIETTASEDQVTYLLLLDNLILEFRPEFVRQYQSPGFETRLIEKIAAAGVVVSPAVIREGRLNLMTVQKSPSSTAQLLINEKNLKLQSKVKIN